MDAANKIVLTNSATWEDWNERYLGQANMYRQLGHIQGKEPLVAKPLKLSMAEYPHKSVTRSRSRQPTQEAAEGATEESPAILTTAATTVGFSDLTPDAQKSYQMA
jgi:hypothetical protein